MHNHQPFINLAIKLEYMLAAQSQVLVLHIRTPKSYAAMYGLQKGVDKEVLLLASIAEVVWHEKFIKKVHAFRQMQITEHKSYKGKLSDNERGEINGMQNYLIDLRKTFAVYYQTATPTVTQAELL